MKKRPSLGVDVFAGDAGLWQQILDAARRNADQLQDHELPPSLRDDFSRIIADGLRSGRLTKDVAKQLEVVGLVPLEAERLATWQLSRLNAQLTQLRDRSLGIEQYTWRQLKDCGCHPNRDGDRFLWSTPPQGGHPGEVEGCRCYAEPALPEFEDLF